MPMPDPDTSNHIHHYEVKGSGLSCWAECPALPVGVRDDGTEGPVCGSCGLGMYGTETICPWCCQNPTSCGEKLAGERGPIVGSKAKIEEALRGEAEGGRAKDEHRVRERRP